MNKNVRRSRFTMPHEVTGTYKCDGTLYPVLVRKVMPNTDFYDSVDVFGRMVPLVNPIYHRFDLFVHAFFVPERILWENHTKFISPEYNEGTPETAYIPPAFAIRPTAEGDASAADVELFKAGSLADHMGIQVNYDTDLGDLPLDDVTTVKFSSLPFRAYQMIWNEHYRDPDIQDPLPIALTDGYVDGLGVSPGEEIQFNFLKKNWEKDYFTGSRPFSQKGQPVPANVAVDVVTVPSGGEFGEGVFSIKDLRWANAFQMFWEKIQRTGSRYRNFLWNFYGERSSDKTLDRPEFIGGGRQPFVISEVLQTSQSDTTPLGTYGGHAITAEKHSFRYHAEEFGYIMVLMSIQPRAKYMNIVNRQLTDVTFYDYPIPEFAHLGAQEVFKYELSGKIDTTLDHDVFGYQDRYAHWKFAGSTVRGKFRTDANLVTFHASRMTDEATVLDDLFMQVNNDDNVNRIFADQSPDFDPLLINIIHRMDIVQPLPKISIPKL